MKTILPWVFWFLVGLAMFGVMNATKAALNYQSLGRDGQVAGLRLSNAPCTQPVVLRHINPEWHSKFKAAVLTYGGKEWHSCYIESDVVVNGKEQKVIFSIDEEGAPFQPIPKSMFREDSI
jgi:hypothetical protein